ncbi:MAG: DUF6134 family protein [Alphaproteobacteria bacterium]
MSRLFFLAFLLLLPSAAHAADPVPANGLSHYIVKRNGDPIGTLKIQIRRDGDRLTATSDYSIKVKLLAIVLYRYDKRMVETYKGGKLASYETDIDDNGTKSRVTVKLVGDQLAITHPKGELTAPGDLLLSTYWPPATVRQTRMIDSSDGVLVSVKISEPAATDLDIDGRTMKASRYEMTGDLKRTLWYDAATGAWLKMKLIASDDSVIEIERDWPPVWKRPLL